MLTNYVMLELMLTRPARAGGRRGDQMLLGSALQMGDGALSRPLPRDPLDVPAEVLDLVAGQLGIADRSCVKRYTERDKTRLDHAWEIQEVFGLRDFAFGEAELTAKVAAQAWNTGDGPFLQEHRNGK